MSASGASDQPISIDVDGVAALVRSLRSMCDELASARSLGLAAALGEPELTQEMNHAERDWSGQRRRLHDYFDGAAAALESAAQAYTETDDSVRRAATPSSSPSVGRR